MRATRWLAAGVALLALSACTGSGPVTATGSPARTSLARPSPSTTPQAGQVVRRPLVLTADLGERPARWHRLAFVPFGAAPSRLGHELPPLHTAVPLMPRSFAVAPDGTFWILDEVKHRVAHYSPEGTFLGAARGLLFDRYHPQPRDVALWGGRLYVLHQFHLAAFFREMVDQGFGPPVELKDPAGESLGMLFVYPSAVPLGLADGHAALDRLGTGPRGIGQVSLGDPARFALGTGLPVGGSVSVDLTEYRDQSFRLVASGPAGRVIQPIRIRMVAGERPSRHRIPAIFSDHIEGGSDGALVLWLKGAPARPSDADAYGGGSWLLEYPTDGAPLVLERLPEAATEDAYQVRHLAVDARGRIYLMLTLKRGMAIYRR